MAAAFMDAGVADSHSALLPEAAFPEDLSGLLLYLPHCPYQSKTSTFPEV